MTKEFIIMPEEFFENTYNAWKSGKFDNINPNLKKSVSNKTSFEVKEILMEHEIFKYFINNYFLLRGEYAISEAMTMGFPKEYWGLLTNYRLLQKDGITKEYVNIPLHNILKIKEKGFSGKLIFNMIDGIIRMLKSYNDMKLSEEVKEDRKLMKELIDKYMHCG